MISYNFYSNFKNISQDTKQLIGRLKANPKFYRDESLHDNTHQTANYLPKYYSQLLQRDKVQLFGVLYDELLFYYTLYPSERHTHKNLLGIYIDVLWYLFNFKITY